MKMKTQSDVVIPAGTEVDVPDDATEVTLSATVAVSDLVAVDPPADAAAE